MSKVPAEDEDNDNGGVHTYEDLRLRLLQSNSSGGFIDVSLGMDTLTYEVVASTEMLRLSDVTNLPVVERERVAAAESPRADTMEAIICAYSWDCTYWTAVARCESTLREKVDTNWPYIGLLQIDVSHTYPNRTCEGLDLYDAADNVECAWRISNGGRYTGAWPACQYQ